MKPSQVFDLIKELSLDKENLLERTIIERLETVEDRDNLSKVLSSVNKYSSKELCLLIKKLNKNILAEQAKIDRIFYKEKK